LRALWSKKLVDLVSLSQDEVRICPSAGASSFRRLEMLKRLLDEVRVRIAQLKRRLTAIPKPRPAASRILGGPWRDVVSSFCFPVSLETKN
jgi:hypothetical protein